MFLNTVRSYLTHLSFIINPENVKLDWKRWVLKGYFRPVSTTTVHLTEGEVNDGITAANFKIRLSKIDNIWSLSTRGKNNDSSSSISELRPIKFMQTMNYSSSELTDLDLSDEDEDLTRTVDLNLHSPFLIDTQTKRGREISEDHDDSKNRSGKRAKLEEIVHSISSQPCTPSSGDTFDGERDSLPKFKAPSHILHSYGPLSATGQPRHEQEEAAEIDVVPACGLPLIPCPPTPSVNDFSSNMNPSPSSRVELNSDFVEIVPHARISSSLQVSLYYYASFFGR